jgi:hypothetical protein
MAQEAFVPWVGTHARGREVERIRRQVERFVAEQRVEADREHERDLVTPGRQPVRGLDERRDIAEVGT